MKMQNIKSSIEKLTYATSIFSLALQKSTFTCDQLGSVLKQLNWYKFHKKSKIISRKSKIKKKQD